MQEPPQPRLSPVEGEHEDPSVLGGGCVATACLSFPMGGPGDQQGSLAVMGPKPISPQFGFTGPPRRE